MSELNGAAFQLSERRFSYQSIDDSKAPSTGNLVRRLGLPNYDNLPTKRRLAISATRHKKKLRRPSQSSHVTKSSSPRRDGSLRPVDPKEASELFYGLAQAAANNRLRQYYEEQAEFMNKVLEDREFLKGYVEQNGNGASNSNSNRNSSVSRSRSQTEESAGYQADSQTAGPTSNGTNTFLDFEKRAATRKRRDEQMAQLSFIINFGLLVIKVIAAILSHSLAVLASAVDSSVDLTSGFVIWLSQRKMKHRNLYKYPRGRSRLEPLALIIVSIIMGALSVQIVLQSVQSIIEGSVEPNIELPTIAIMITTIGFKVFLMIICNCFRSPNTQVLAQDHRNDVMSNTVALICAYVGYRFWQLADPLGALLVSVYIFASWFQTGSEHISVISGESASVEFYNRILWICVNHNPQIKFIDTIHVYHFGMNFLVEVHVVMDERMHIKEAHDIVEDLQQKIEHLPYVERAFFHIDYEFEHKPEQEHKID